MALAAAGQKLLWTKTAAPGGGNQVLYFRYVSHLYLALFLLGVK